SGTYPVVYCIGQILVVKIIEPKRYALWPEQVFVAVVLTSGNSGIKACCEIQKIKCRRVTRINIESECPEMCKIRFGWYLLPTVCAVFTINFDFEAAGLDQTCQNPL